MEEYFLKEVRKLELCDQCWISVWSALDQCVVSVWTAVDQCVISGGSVVDG